MAGGDSKTTEDKDLTDQGFVYKFGMQAYKGESAAECKKIIFEEIFHMLN